MTPLQRIAAAHLAAGMKQVVIAFELDLHPTTITRWCKSPAFQTAVEEELEKRMEVIRREPSAPASTAP